MKNLLSTLILCMVFAGAYTVSAKNPKSVPAPVRKTVSILGDSYSTYQDYVYPDTNRVWYHAPLDTNATDVNSVTQTWWHKFITENGFKLGVNNSFSGATVCYTGYKGRDYTNRSFANRVKYLGNPDIILIFGATNDDWAKAPLGEYKYADWTAEDLKSFRPAMCYMLKNVKERYPNVEVYFILNDCLRDEINETIKTTCNYYSVPVIKLHDIDKKKRHPTIKGMEQIAAQLKQALNL